MIKDYRPTDLETQLCRLYQSAGIASADELTCDRVAEIFHTRIFYYSHPPLSVWGDGNNVIMLDRRVSIQDQRADFFHELGHIALHVGKQPGMHKLFIEMQEWQANRFQLVASMPCILLPKEARTWNAYTYILAETFHVPIDLAAKRSEQIKQRIISDTFWEAQRWHSKRFPPRINRDINGSM